MKVLVIGDQHFKENNVQEVELFLSYLSELLNKIKVDLIISGGDLLDTHEKLHIIPLNYAVKYVDLLRRHSMTYILVGNHDAQNNQIFLTENHWLNVLKGKDNLTVVDKVMEHKGLIFSPYVPDGRFIEALDTIDNWRSAKAIFAHQLLDNAKMGAIVAKGVEEWKEEYPLVISCHIHDKQTPQKNLIYVGSAFQHSFGEKTKKTLSLFTLEDNEVKREELDLHLPKRKTEYLSTQEIKNYEIKESKDKIKISISGDSEEFKTFKKTEKYKQLIQKGIRVVFKQKKMIRNIRKDTKRKHFNEILYELISSLSNRLLHEYYSQIISPFLNTEIIFE